MQAESCLLSVIKYYISLAKQEKKLLTKALLYYLEMATSAF